MSRDAAAHEVEVQLRLFRQLAIEAIERWEEYAHNVSANDGNAVYLRDRARLDLVRIVNARKVI